MPMNKQAWPTAALAFCLATASAVAAAPASAQEVNDGWRVTATPYLWAAAFKNDVSNSANGQTSSSSASFFDIVDKLSFAVMGEAEVQYQRIGVRGDLVYLKVKTDRTTNRPVLGPVETEARVATTTGTLMAFYRAVESHDLSVDLLGGVRYVKLKLDFDVQGPGAGFSHNGSASVTKANLGVRATKRLGPKLSLSGYGDFGGFSGAVRAWELEGTLDYQWSPSITAFAGYRRLSIDIDKGPVSADSSFSGPILGTTFRF